MTTCLFETQRLKNSQICACRIFPDVLSQNFVVLRMPSLHESLWKSKPNIHCPCRANWVSFVVIGEKRRGTLLEEQNTMTIVSLLLLNGSFCNSTLITHGSSTWNGIKMAAIGQNLRAIYEENLVHMSLYFAFYWLYLSETLHLSLSAQVVQLV